MPGISALCDTICACHSAEIAARDVYASTLDAITSVIVCICCPDYLLLYSLLLAVVIVRLNQKA